MDFRLLGRAAAVACADSGLGYSAAAALLDEGARVSICGRDARRVAAAAASLRAHGEVHAIVADISEPFRAGEFVTAAAAAMGGIDILVPNIGGAVFGTFATCDIGDYRSTLELKFSTVVEMCQAALPAMRRARWGRVVAITGLSTRTPRPEMIGANVARAALTAFLRITATEVAADGVTVNSVQPGIVATERNRALLGRNADAVAATVPVGELGDPADLGALVAFLCSDQARFITGAAVPFDGGLSPHLQ